jgi:hypothetical protein
MAVATARQSWSIVRAAALRRSALSLEKAFSIGLKSGEVRRQEHQPGASRLYRLTGRKRLVSR